MVFKSFKWLVSPLLFLAILIAGKEPFAMEWLDEPLKVERSSGFAVGLRAPHNQHAAWANDIPSAYPTYVSPEIDMSNIHGRFYPQAVITRPYGGYPVWAGIALKKRQADGTNAYLVIQDYDGPISNQPQSNSLNPFIVLPHYLLGGDLPEEDRDGIKWYEYSLRAMVQGTANFPATFIGGEATFAGPKIIHNSVGRPHLVPSPNNFILDLPNKGLPGVFWSAIREEQGAQRRITTAHVFLTQAEKMDLVESLRLARGISPITPRHILNYFQTRAEPWARDIAEVLHDFSPPESLKQFLALEIPPAPTPFLAPVGEKKKATSRHAATSKRTVRTRKTKRVRKTALRRTKRVRRIALRKTKRVRRTALKRTKRVRKTGRTRRKQRS